MQLCVINRQMIFTVISLSSALKRMSVASENRSSTLQDKPTITYSTDKSRLLINSKMLLLILMLKPVLCRLAAFSEVIVQ